ncbi:HET-domain-containing protein, partial [Dothidotthia symphoricarpi CBS 119687]
RILRLEPGQEDDPIQCSLIHVDLDTSPVFEAVSYVWGDATDKLRITCNDRRIKITRNLFHALTMFRYPDRTRDLWADALCINQFNLKERSSQVQLMSRIYSGAKAVLVWLGHEQ